MVVQDAGIQMGGDYHHKMVVKAMGIKMGSYDHLKIRP